jgi:hypothetical protein
MRITKTLKSTKSKSTKPKLKNVKKKQPKKGGGGKLNRSEVIQTRLNPKLRFIAEVMARQERRTLSSLIEGLIEEAAEQHRIPLVLSERSQTDRYLFGKRKYQKVSMKSAADLIWSAEEADRFAGLALFLPDLLTPEEEALWNLITYTPYFWQHFETNIETKSGKVIGHEWWPLVDYHGLIREHLREHWSLLQAILEGRESVETFKQLNLPLGQAVEKPEYYPYPIKKIDTRVD